jgi:glycosyltransferase involved in cell wall biosynthesis
VDVTLVTTDGDGSMDRYGRRLASLLPVRSVRLDVDGRASAGLFQVPLLGRAQRRALRHDAALVRRLRGESGLLHLAHHHLARYGPALGRPYLLTAHDLIRWHDLRARDGTVHISRPRARDRLWSRLDYAGFRRAAALVVPSDFTRRELHAHLGIPHERVHVVPLGVDHVLFRPVERRLAEPPYVLFVGSEHPRKDLPTLLRALSLVRRDRRFRAVRLVKVGAAGSAEADFRAPAARVIRELGLAGAVVFTGPVPDADLPAYYSGAECLVLPSRAEGFGLPPLEAMACGCPVVVSTAGALPEVTGGAAVQVPPANPDSLAAALVTVLADDRARGELRRLGLARAAAYTWERTARETAAVWAGWSDRAPGG